MSAAAFVAKINFGMPVENIRLKFKMLRRHFETQEAIAKAGIALYVAEVMERHSWYLTAESFLVCSEQSDLSVNEVEVVVDNDFLSNMEWLVKQFRHLDTGFRPYASGFPVCIQPSRQGVRQCFFGSFSKPAS